MKDSEKKRIRNLLKKIDEDYDRDPELDEKLREYFLKYSYLTREELDEVFR